jgi:hypothetical protein
MNTQEQFAALLASLERIEHKLNVLLGDQAAEQVAA